MCDSNSDYSERPAKRAKVESKSEAAKAEIQVGFLDHIVCKPGQLIGQYKIEKTIGEGSFGRVVHAKNVISGEDAALKIIKNDPDKLKIAMAEIGALKSIASNDPYDESFCIKMLDYIISDEYLCILFPVLGMSAYDLIKKTTFDSFPMDDLRHISHQLCHAVNFLHRNGMTHTDLKTENILFVDSTYTIYYDVQKECYFKKLNRTDIRLIDFGLLTRDEDAHSSLVSTQYYRAPEVIMELGWSHPCDVWSVGCILVEMYFGSTLFDTQGEALEHLSMMEKTLGPIPVTMATRSKTNYFKDGILDWKWKYLEGSEIPLEKYKLFETDDDTKLFELIEKLLEYEPGERISLSEALKYPFFNKLRLQQVNNMKL